MAEDEPRTGWGIWIAVLAVPVLLTIGGAVLIFVLPSRGYEPSPPTTSYLQDADCRSANAELALRGFRLERPTSMIAHGCLEQEPAWSYVEFQSSGDDTALRVAVLPAPGVEDTTDFDARVLAHIASDAATPRELSRAAYPARGSELPRRDLQLGEWVVHAVLLPRPHGEGGVILRGQARVGESPTATLRALSQVMAPIVESLRF
ncbi:MAG: hypothetical protein GXP55_19290 [Deltaproteobacteria bacterium]|nr:hypothetical protein [Deltaproteobacteria bacterium]